MNEIPLYLFVFLMIVTLYSAMQALSDTSLWSLFTAFMAAVLSFVLAKVSINGQLVQNFGEISSTDTIVTGTSAVQNSAQAWFFVAIAIFMIVRLLMILVENYKDTYGEVTE